MNFWFFPVGLFTPPCLRRSLTTQPQSKKLIAINNLVEARTSWLDSCIYSKTFRLEERGRLVSGHFWPDRSKPGAIRCHVFLTCRA